MDFLVGERFVTGEGPGETIIEPATGATIATIAEASGPQVDAAVRAADAAFPAWSRTPPAERAAALLKIADAIEAQAQAFAALESRNCGKPLARVIEDEIPAIVDCFRFFAGAARCQAGPVAGEYMAGHTSMLRRDAIGVVGAVVPWNYPLMMLAWKAAPALAAGNTIVLKPSENTPLTALKFAEIVVGILPPGVFNLVLGRGGSVGQALISHPGVRMVSLTGDVATGQAVLAAAAKSVRRTHLELGGKAPVIVFDDADLDAVVAGLRTFGYYNAGQDCTAACRVYAGAKIYDKLVADLSSAVASLKVGLPDDADAELGSLISARQRERVAGFVDRFTEVDEAVRASCATSRSPPAARRARAAASSTRRPWSPARCSRTRSSGARYSARSSRSPASPRWTRRSPGPTTPITASPRRSRGRGTSARR